MHAQLPVLSFLCAAILTVFLSLRRLRTNIANLSIIAWLVGCNVIHGINAIVWNNNVKFSIPVWCDIATKLLLGVMIALPAACLCISRQLERISSSRAISDDSYSRRNHTLIDISLCVLLPIIYMLMHTLSQDHRFDIVQDFGCFPSIHPSYLGLLVIWLPPLIICSISFIYSGFTLYNLFHLGSSGLQAHVSIRSSMSSSHFVHSLGLSTALTTLTTSLTLFAFLAPLNLVPWVSWSNVHADFFTIHVVESASEIRNFQVMWWGMPLLSLFYILLFLAFGNELRSLLVRLRRTVFTSRSATVTILPTYQCEKGSEMICRTGSLSVPHPEPHTVELTSGWDEMLKSKSQSSKRGSRSPSALFTSPSSPSPSSSSSKDDDAFMVSTLHYLGSPIAETLGHSSSPSLLSHGNDNTQLSTSQQISAEALSTQAFHKNSHLEPPQFPQTVPEDASSTISSIWDVPWPQPPSSVPSSPTQSYPARRPVVSPSSSRPQSASSRSSVDTMGFELYPTITLPNTQTQPFQGPGIRAVSSIPHHTVRRPSKDLKRLGSKSRSKEGLGGHSPNDVIYMTVVTETV